MKQWPTKYTASLYAYRDNEIEAEREIRKRNRRDIVETIVCTPIIVAGIVVMLCF